MLKRVIIIAGPTASHKSAMAIEVAREFSGLIINADSMQVYKQLNLLTARPQTECLKMAPHRLYGILDADDPCSVGRWLDLVIVEVERAWVQKKLPIIVGGTGMYIKALLSGLAPIPSIPPSSRADIIELYEKLGENLFRKELALLDPEATIRINQGDSQRLIRAFEVVKVTGRSLSDWQKEQTNASFADTSFGVIALLPERQDIYSQVNVRFDWMIKNGVMDEVRDVLHLQLDKNLPLMKAVGLPELLSVFNGETDLESAKNDAKKATRRLAKRQLTWFRNQLEADLIINTQYSKRIRDKIFSFIRQFMLTESF